MYTIIPDILMVIKYQEFLTRRIENSHPIGQVKKSCRNKTKHERYDAILANMLSITYAYLFQL